MDCSPPGKNTGVGCHFLLQYLSHSGIKPAYNYVKFKNKIKLEKKIKNKKNKNKKMKLKKKKTTPASSALAFCTAYLHTEPPGKPPLKDTWMKYIV